jgi:hypothetical protein
VLEKSQLEQLRQLEELEKQSEQGDVAEPPKGEIDYVGACPPENQKYLRYIFLSTPIICNALARADLCSLFLAMMGVDISVQGMAELMREDNVRQVQPSKPTTSDPDALSVAGSPSLSDKSSTHQDIYRCVRAELSYRSRGRSRGVLHLPEAHGPERAGRSACPQPPLAQSTQPSLMSFIWLQLLVSNALCATDVPRLSLFLSFSLSATLPCFAVSDLRRRTAGNATSAARRCWANASVRTGRTSTARLTTSASSSALSAESASSSALHTYTHTHTHVSISRNMICVFFTPVHFFTVLTILE